MNKNEMYKGYRGKAKQKLIDEKVKVWSDVIVQTKKGKFKGIILPRSETADDRHIVLKLHNGYNSPGVNAGITAPVL